MRFKRRAKAETDATRAMDEYVAEGEKRREKTAKLKALRLAKEAEERAATDTARPKTRKRPARRK